MTKLTTGRSLPNVCRPLSVVSTSAWFNDASSWPGHPAPKNELWPCRNVIWQNAVKYNPDFIVFKKASKQSRHHRQIKLQSQISMKAAFQSLVKPTIISTILNSCYNLWLYDEIILSSCSILQVPLGYGFQ